ncbi:MAG: Ig-like domain-containing protein [Thermoplasmata archaeon]|nr:Ig-like domain-containing protein [Thermoplasmata archaeon]
MGEYILDKRQLERSAVAAIVVLCLIAAALIPAGSSRADPYDATDDPVMCVTGQTEAAGAGRCIAFLDINHDGVGDLVVGSPGDSSGGLGAGKVLIYLGDETVPGPDVEIAGSEGEGFGFSVARAGDVNADGIDDLIIGAPDNDSAGLDAGAVYVILGSDDVDDLPDRSYDADIIIEGELERGQLGYSVSTAGDANMDGSDDVIVGAPFAEGGAVYLLYGGDSMGEALDKTFTGSSEGDQFGFSVAGGVNLDGNPLPDIAVGAPGSGDDNTGEVRVILNPSKAVPKESILEGSAEKDRFGTSVAVLDYNGDIYGDVGVGAPYAASVGEVSLYYGSSTSGKFDKNVDVTFSLGQPGDMFGVSIAGGDPRTDNIGDLVVGAPMNDTAANNAGRAYVFYGNSTADSVPDVIVDGTEADSWFGLSVSSGGNESADYNDDDAADFAVGAPRCGENNEGAAYLYLGILVIVPANPIIWGYVLDEVDRGGLSDALVTMESLAYSDSVRTTANGSYGVTTPVSLPPGTYWINASCSGYIMQSKQRDLASDTRVNVSFDMERWPVVQGVISDGNTTGPLPLEDALVEVRDSSDTLLGEITTDSTGEYYFVLEVEGAWSPYEDDITITATKEYYFDGEKTLKVAGSDDLWGNLTLNHYPILIVSINDTKDDPIEGVDVSVSIDGKLLETGETDETGQTMIMVPGEGSAYVNSSKLGYVANSSVVDLAANELEELHEVMDAQPSISGTIKDSLFLSPVFGAVIDLFEAGSTDVLESETSNSYGSYNFDVAEEGMYDLRVTAAGYIREYRTSVEVVADVTTTENFWLDIDTLSPTSEISDPQPGIQCSTPEVTVYANATDPDGNDIREVALYYSHGGKPYTLWGDADSEEPYVFIFNASEAHDAGIYEFYTIAVDWAGNVETTPTSNDTWIIMSYSMPESEVSAIDPFQSTETFTVEASASDPFGVDYVELWYSYDGGAFVLHDQDATSPYAWEFSATDGDGEYAFYSILVNGIGQVEPPPDEADAMTVVDTIAPTVSITSPVDGTITDSEEVTVEYTTDGTGTNVVSVERRVDGGSWESADATSTVVSSLDEGAHTVEIRVTDEAGHTAIDSVEFVVNLGLPEITITSPADGAVLNIDSVTVEWTLSDQDASVDARLDEGEWQAVTGDSVTFSDLDDGEHTVDVRATNLADNSATDSVTFTVSTDTTAPVVSITSPANGTSLNSSSVTVTWTASDGAGSGIALMEIKLDSGAWTAVTSNLRQFIELAQGSHNVSVRVTDNADNVATASVTFMVDTANPTLSITSPQDGWETSDQSVTIEWTCSDAGCGIDRIEVCIDGGSYFSVGTASECAFSDLEAGEHTVEVRAYDKAGNTGEAAVTFTVAEDGGGISALVIAGIVLVIIVLAALAVMLMRRKKAPAPPVE